MALISCPECGKEGVSNTAISCPGCGFNIKEYCEIMNSYSDEYCDEYIDDSNLSEEQLPDSNISEINKKRNGKRKQNNLIKALTTVLIYLIPIIIFIIFIQIVLTKRKIDIYEDAILDKFEKANIEYEVSETKFDYFNNEIEMVIITKNARYKAIIEKSSDSSNRVKKLLVEK